jgi:hypothetical protein
VLSDCAESESSSRVDGLMASTFFAPNGLVCCGHMCGLVARRICPLALMKSDDRNPYQICESTGCFGSSVATVSFIAHQYACQTSNCDLWNCSVLLSRSNRVGVSSMGGRMSSSPSTTSAGPVSNGSRKEKARSNGHGCHAGRSPLMRFAYSFMRSPTTSAIS